jgi:GNAT superfamily N-acetyltransferase
MIQQIIVKKDELNAAPRLINIVHLSYNFLRPLELEYPQFKAWYFNKVVPDLYTYKRTLLVLQDGGTVAGVAILKDDDEKKICTLRIHTEYQRRGFGATLLKSSIDILKTKQPMITVSSTRIEQFRKLFYRFGFTLRGIKKNMYTFNRDEYYFNIGPDGVLISEYPAGRSLDIEWQSIMY